LPRPVVAHRSRVAGSATAVYPPFLSSDRRPPVPVVPYRQVAGVLDLSEARRFIPQSGCSPSSRTRAGQPIAPSPLLGSHQLQFAGTSDRVTASGRGELAQDVSDVGANRIHGDEHGRGDLLGGQQFAEIAENLRFAGGQCLELDQRNGWSKLRRVPRNNAFTGRTCRVEPARD